MAPKISRPTLHLFGVLSVLLMLSAQRGNAFQFKVGGSNGDWAVPSHPNAPIYNQWAEKTRFQNGDSILFVYDANHDSVLHVTKDDYANCNTGSYLEKFTDGHTVYQFNQSGPHYFISGVADNCHKNQKLVVVVMADRTTTKHNSNETAPSPAPTMSPPSSNKTAPSPAPTMSPPSPAPAGQEPPSPPPSEEEPSPTPAPTPTGESAPSRPKSGAAEIAYGVLGMVAIIGASLVLGF